jgi:hypothetical protein
MTSLWRWFLAGVAIFGLDAAFGSAGFHFDEPTIILSTQDMVHNGLMFPDGTMGFVRQQGRDPYYVSGSGGRSSGVGLSAKLPTGSYAFAGTLESLRPSRQRDGWPANSLSSGRQQPSPDRSDFDRDYAGGGPTYLLQLPDGRGSADDVCAHASELQKVVPVRRVILLQIYHGEYHLLAPQSMPAYGGSGMAISCDGGGTFEKIGQILAPRVSREQFLAAHGTGGLWADGAMVEADARGERDCGKSACAGGDTRYYYLVFTDHNSSDERYTGLSIARIRVEDLLSAVRQRRAPQFRKYFNPSGAITFDGDYFTESGIGGQSTPILYVVGKYMNTPGVLYDAFLRKFVLFYQANQKEVVLRTSENLLSWSPAEIAYRLDPASSRKVFYPSVAGDGADPQVLEQMFYLYFLVREQGEHGFVNPQLLRQRVSVMP